MEETLFLLAANSVKTDGLIRDSIQHDKRLGSLETATAKHDHSITRFERHLENDTPAQAVLNRHAWKVVTVVATLIGGWFLHGLLGALSIFEGK